MSAQPVIALPAKRHRKAAQYAIILGPGIAGYADHHLRLRYVQAQRTVKPIPPWEYNAEVREVFLANVGMVNAVHSRRDQQHVEGALEEERQPGIAVMEKRAELKRGLIDRVSEKRRADENHLKDAQPGREPNLHEVKAERRGDVEIRIDM